MELLETKTYSINLFAELEVVLPPNANINPSDITIALKRGFCSAKNKVAKKKPKKIAVSRDTKERVYDE